MKPVKSLNLIFSLIEYLLKALEWQTCWTKTNLFFWKTDRNLGTFERLFPNIRVSYKIFLTSVKSFNGIFWTLEYSFKELECQIWFTNTKSFLGENEAKLETLQNLPPSAGVSYKFVSNSVRSLNRIFFVIRYWFKALECQI